jgi:aminoglycoside 6'-N-acetyltransferase
MRAHPAIEPTGIEFRRVAEADFSLLTAWFAEPHVRRFYQKTPVTLAEVAAEYGPAIRGEEPTLCYLAAEGATPYAYLQCYRNMDYPEWANVIGVSDGISLDLFIGEPAYLRRGLGRAALGGFLRRIAFPRYIGETRAYIAHERTNTTALRCSEAVGFRHLRDFREHGIETVLLAIERAE